ncbi:MAG: hypothetical protein A2Y38_00525 [Spirochaetes bacterium GWB1_59_5]|nr:MAG: hypothetical protein A2Y38_00525 [Spirochaetes bacterium GWB1_59_5]
MLRIKNYEVPQQVLEACIAAMKSGVFRSSDVASMAHSCIGKPWNKVLADRIADRLIQKMRREKKIKMLAFPKWQWVDRE